MVCLLHVGGKYVGEYEDTGSGWSFLVLIRTSFEDVVLARLSDPWALKPDSWFISTVGRAALALKAVCFIIDHTEEKSTVLELFLYF